MRLHYSHMQLRRDKMRLLTTIKTYLQPLQYMLIIAIVMTLPYWGLYSYFKYPTILLFLITLVTGQIDFKNIIKNKVILSLFAFILFTYLSVLWTSANPVFTWEFELNFDRFKYYFLLIIAIYSTSLTTKQIKSIFFIMALSPLYTVVVYYLNALGITHVYSALWYEGESKLLTHYLVNNFFILYSAIYFYILFFDNLMKKKYKLSILAAFLTILFFISLFIDTITTARLMILVFFMLIIIIPLFYLKRKQVIFVVLLSAVFAALFINTNPGMQKGLKTFSTAISEDKYTGSWGHRLGFAIVGIKIFQENPIIGRGISDVRERTLLFAKENPKYFIGDPGRHFHNEHIHLLVQVGIVGYSLFLLFILLFLRSSINDEFLHRLKYAFVFSFLLLMFGEHYLSIWTTSSFFALFIALILLYHKRELSEIEKATKS